jgi:hypothetical protein
MVIVSGSQFYMAIIFSVFGVFSGYKTSLAEKLMTGGRGREEFGGVGAALF